MTKGLFLHPPPPIQNHGVTYKRKYQLVHRLVLEDEKKALNMCDVNLINVEMQVQRKKEEVYTNYLKDCVKSNDCDGVKCSLENIIVPCSVLTFDILENTSVNIIELLIESKIKNDDFVSAIYSFCKLHNIESIHAEDIDRILTHFNLQTENDYYNRYVIINLFNNKSKYNCSSWDYFSNLHSDNLLRNYKNIVQLANKIFCDCAYYCNVNFLVQFMSLIKKYNIVVKFNPMTEPTHRQVFEWLRVNIEKAENGIAVGWRSGPDSGKWPSTDPEDYFAVCKYLRSLL